MLNFGYSEYGLGMVQCGIARRVDEIYQGQYDCVSDYLTQVFDSCCVSLPMNL